MKIRTTDRLNFFTTESLGESRKITPEGFLLCEGVAIARIGSQVYAADELPVDPGKDGMIRIERLPDEVFREETIASFEGKPVTVNHPDSFVTPETWNQLAVGVVQNVRRGEGIEDDLLKADLLITAADAIAYVNKSLPELSAGYDAEYEQTEPGRGLQRNIIGNHVALVERGRAGPRCAIKDGEPSMKKQKRSFWDRLMTAVKAQDEEAVKAEIESRESEDEEGEAEKVDNDLDRQVLARIERLEAMIEKLAGKTADEDKSDEEESSETEDEDEESEETEDTVIEAETAKKADVGTVYTGDAFKQIVARAEILAPGISVPTGDAAGGGKAAERLMRHALTTAQKTEDGAAAIKPFLMGRSLKNLTGDALLGVFNGAAELVRVRNNQQIERKHIATRDFGKPLGVSDINARNRDFWAKH
jgi:hypothetical protein